MLMSRDSDNPCYLCLHRAPGCHRDCEKDKAYQAFYHEKHEAERLSKLRPSYMPNKAAGQR
jgi:hypothetical protein